MATKITHPADQLVADMTSGFDTAEAPGGAYRRVMVGKKSAAWVIRLKTGQVRLILRVEGTPPAKLADGMWVEAKTGHAQFRLGIGDVKRGRQLIEWAIGKLPSEEQQAAAKEAPAAKPVKTKAVKEVVIA
jgi:hypothetical protein